MSKKDEERTIQMCHRLADVSLKTSASMLAIIFAYTFAMSGELGSLPSELTFYKAIIDNRMISIPITDTAARSFTYLVSVESY